MSPPEALSSNVAEPDAQLAFLKPMPTRRGEEGGSESRTGAASPPAWPAVDSSTFTKLFPLDVSESGPVDSAADVAGLRLGHFVIEERIGRGGMGAVFRAVDERLDRVVALKVLAPVHSRDPASVKRFHNEARAAARLDHENIARVHYYGEDRGLNFIAFEFVRGTNIRDFILQKGMLDPRDAVNYALQVAQALRHTHAAGVVHRDIKPSNIIVTPSGRAKLVDLGLARQEHSFAESQDLTVAGTTLGTFDYIAPEQARDPRNVDVRADIYSLGCTLYHMVTGEPPFPNGSMIQKVMSHHQGAAPDAAALNPRVPPQLSRVIRKMMASNRDERYATPDHLVNDLALVARALGLRPTDPEGLVWSTPLFGKTSLLWVAWQQNRVWLLMIAALLLIVVGLNNVPWEQFVDVSGAPPTVVENTPPPAPPEPEPAADAPESSAEDALFVPPPPDRPPPASLAAVIPPPVSVVTDPRTGSSSTDPDGAANTEEPPPLPSDAEERLPEAPPPRTTAETSPDAADATTAVEREAAPPEGPFVLYENGTVRAFPSLEAACREAGPDSHIELRHDGLWPDPQGPIVIENKRVVISSRPGSRATLVFAASEHQGHVTPTQMIRVRNGSLELNDVDIVMQARPIPADDDWALIVLDQAERIGLRGVSVAVSNPSDVPAAVIELAEPTDADLERMNVAMEMRRRVDIGIEDCLLTGRCDVLSQKTVDPATTVVRNTAIGVRGAFLRVRGEDRTADADQVFAVELRHVTALLEEGLLRVDTDLAGDLLPMELSCQESLFVVDPDEPLIEMHGHQSTDFFLQTSLSWRDRLSYFDVREPAVVIAAAGLGLPTEYGFSRLSDRSGEAVVSDALVRRLDWSVDEFTELSPEDFRVRRSAPFLQDGNGSVVGVRRLDLLPQPPDVDASE